MCYKYLSNTNASLSVENTIHSSKAYMNENNIPHSLLHTQVCLSKLSVFLYTLHYFKLCFIIVISNNTLKCTVNVCASFQSNVKQQNTVQYKTLQSSVTQCNKTQHNCGTRGRILKYWLIFELASQEHIWALKLFW